MTSTDRMRSLRARRKNGVVGFHFEFDEVELVEALVADGFLDPDQIEDPAAVRAALERMVAAFVLDANA